MKIMEPAADLAIALAIASAVKDKPIAKQVAAFGEISLAGEIRGVSNVAQRIQEAKRLGHPQVVGNKGQLIKEAISQGLS
jgi:DNA repair protein RadA/Sms